MAAATKQGGNRQEQYKVASFHQLDIWFGKDTLFAKTQTAAKDTKTLAAIIVTHCSFLLLLLMQTALPMLRRLPPP
ncbi:MAG: hypothetical protein J6Z26_04050, partial [Bacteroidales bacterium]|nr:hypothetical protein [Bacteroidales bacterium]